MLDRWLIIMGPLLSRLLEATGIAGMDPLGFATSMMWRSEGKKKGKKTQGAGS